MKKLYYSTWCEVNKDGSAGEFKEDIFCNFEGAEDDEIGILEDMLFWIRDWCDWFQPTNNEYDASYVEMYCIKKVLWGFDIGYSVTISENGEEKEYFFTVPELIEGADFSTVPSSEDYVFFRHNLQVWCEGIQGYTGEWETVSAIKEVLEKNKGEEDIWKLSDFLEREFDELGEFNGECDD